MRSSCRNSPLKSLMIPLRVECQPESEDSLARGNGDVEDEVDDNSDSDAGGRFSSSERSEGGKKKGRPGFEGRFKA